ncbi:MAG: SAM-dependent methyltransferase [Clostridiales bacterium]|nr:MAG: SAM-dependent methyltransferase [Clostridiales bacterium]
MQLSKRLKAIFDMVGKTNVFADVGTDHAYLPIKLYNEKKVKKVIVSDINKGPLELAKNNARENFVFDDFSFRLGSGLVPYEVGEVDVYVIAGMGGHLISDIIMNSVDKARSCDYMILQPMSNQKILREILNRNDFTIISEVVVREDNKYYQILKVKSGKQKKLSLYELELGFNIKNTGEYLDFLNNQKSKYMKIINNRKLSNKDFDSREFMDLVTNIEILLGKNNGK